MITGFNNKELENISDNQLLERFYRSNNNEWLGILLQRYTLLVLGVCMKYLKNEEEAKDAVQQIFLKVINEIQRHNIDFFKGWLYAVTRNYCLMKLRRKSTKNALELSNLTQLPAEESPIEDRNQRDKLLSLIETSLPQLSDEQKTCLTLFYLNKKSYSHICEQTGYTLLQVKSYIQNGKRNLKLLVEKKMK